MLDVKRALHAVKVPARTRTERILTPWGAELLAGDEGLPALAEHPRPTMMRCSYQTLNGMWEFAFEPLGRALPRRKGAARGLDAEAALEACREARPPVTYAGRIRVPFSPEAPLSGVGRALLPNELLWYRRSIVEPAMPTGHRLILHIEAIDWVCALRVNGQLAGAHVGAYLPFDIDITPHLNGVAGSKTTLELCVYDPSDLGVQLRGKQSLKPGGIWYSAQSGIWQSVWYEIVPAAHLTRLTLNGTDAGKLSVQASALLPKGATGRLEIALMDREGACTARHALPLSPDAGMRRIAPWEHPQDTRPEDVRRMRVDDTVRIEHPHRWSPDDPFLYRVEARLVIDGADGRETADTVESYCAFRTVAIERDASGIPRLTLNGAPILLAGVLDQGYWPDGLLTAPSDEALVFDIEAARDAGFNMMRKHLKIESERWYYHCDRLGMLVVQDAVQGGGPYDLWLVSRKPTVFSCTWSRYRDNAPAHRAALAADDTRYQLEWLDTCAEAVRLLAGHPSIIIWSLFNEGFGQFDARGATELVRSIDCSRPIDAVSGWYDQRCGDFISHHNYFRPLTVARDHSRRAGAMPRAYLISEFGGWALPVEGHRFSDAAYGYGDFPDADAWRAAVRRSLADARALEPRGLAGFVYTQLSDVEDEVNGLITYDRRVNKLA